ncbi:MAG: hypothetical protein WA175_05170 [Candidatus Acidiferrales bacterium]
MPDDKRFDPFKPQQPRIPGVPASVCLDKLASSPPDEGLPVPGKTGAGIRKLSASLVAAGVLIVVIAAFLHSRISSREPDQANSSPAGATSPSSAAAAASKSAEDLPVAPGEVAKADELAKAWSAKRFLFRNPATGDLAPAMVVRLPGGEYWGFSLREPFGNCDLEYVTDMAALQTNYNFSADHPMVGDPCNHSVFDLMRYGTTPSGTVVRGEIEQGGAIRPPIAIEIRKEGNEIRAVRME